jgi:hypothetical protein
MVSFFNIVKYIFVPSLHIEVIRVLYYGGALVSSLIFFDKNFASGAIKTKLATILVLSTMAFVFGETLIFYLELSYGRAFLSCIGLLLIYFLSLQQRKNVVEILVGVAMILLPILPQLNKGNIDIHKMNLKREIAIRELFEGAPKAPFNQENPEGNSF